MSTYYRRYKSGECRAVIRELTDLGKDCYATSTRSDAVDVAREFVDRSFKNLALLARRLNDLGYLFEHPDAALCEATSEDLAALDELETEMGPLPIIVRHWYERIKCVDFNQGGTQLYTKDPSQCCPTSGLGLNVPLVFCSVPKCLVLRDELREAMAPDGVSSELQDFLPLGGFASNCNPKGFFLPCDSFDAEFYNDGDGPTFFAEELRNAFEWGGFPIWGTIKNKKQVQGLLGSVPNIETLLPGLKEGLLPI